MPIDGGYLSVRIKPSSATSRHRRGRIRGAAAGARPRGWTPAPRRRRCWRRMVALGHADYDEFMAAALAAELSVAGPGADSAGPRRCCRGSPRSAPGCARCWPRSTLLLKGFDEISAIPMNLHITASRIEAYGGPVATLAENYRLMAADITRRLEIIVGPDAAEADAPTAALASRCSARSPPALFRSAARSCKAKRSGAARRRGRRHRRSTRWPRPAADPALARHCGVEAGAGAGTRSARMSSGAEGLLRGSEAADAGARFDPRCCAGSRPGGCRASGSALAVDHRPARHLSCRHRDPAGPDADPGALRSVTAAEITAAAGPARPGASRRRSAPRRQRPARRPARPGNVARRNGVSM